MGVAQPKSKRSVRLRALAAMRASRDNARLTRKDIP